MKKEECCKTCKYWQDYNQRVHARISNVYGRTGGLVELRCCGYSPNPNVERAGWGPIYTDEEFLCSEYVKAEK